jgi:capsular exopolysaccharide synthesis family protein
MNRITSITIRHWQYLLVFNLLVLGTIASKVYVSPKMWLAQAQLIMPENTGKLDANLGTLGSLKSGDTGFSSQINPLLAQQSILMSKIVMEKVLAADTEKVNFTKVNSYQNLFEVSIGEQSTTINISVKGSREEVAKQRAKKWIEIYQQRLKELRQENSQAQIGFTEKDLEKARQRLNKAQVALAQLQQSSGLVDTESQTKGIVQVIDQLTASKYQAQVQAEAQENKIAALSSRLGLTPSEAIKSISLSENQGYQLMQNKLKEVEIALVGLQSTRTDKDPQIQDLLQQKDELQRQLQEYNQSGGDNLKIDTTISDRAGKANLIQELILAESQANVSRKEAEQLETKIEQLRTNLEAIPAYETPLQQLRKQKDVAEGVYQGMVAKLEEAKIDAFNAYPPIQILEPPTVDPTPVSPQKSLAVLNAFLASIIGSIALILLLEKRNPLLSPTDLSSFSFPILATIRKLRSSYLLSSLLSATGTQIEIDFQRLASIISLKLGKNQRLLVTSAMSGEGKTTVTLGLAKSLVELGFKVLIVDGDFYRGELTKNLVYSQEEVISGQPIQLIPNLYLMPNWIQPNNATAIVAQGEFEKSLIKAGIQTKYDYILIDSSPVSLTSESALMATVASNVLFVVKPNFSQRNPVHNSFEQIIRHNGNILGVVLNEVKINSQPYYYQNKHHLLQPSLQEEITDIDC